MNSKIPTVVVLGASGMLGRVVYQFLKNEHPLNIFGTDRNDRRYLKFDALLSALWLRHLKVKLRKIDYIINCIGILNNNANKDAPDTMQINSFFPNKLARWAEKNNCKVIHVSTDAVFPPDAGRVCEKDEIFPVDLYGSSKFLGEPISSKALTVRTSIVGFDPIKKKGLLERILNNKSKTINGYTNQMWSGCTVLQFAMLCDDLIFNGEFDILRKKTRIIHFAPIVKISKFEMIKSINKMFSLKKQVKKGKSPQISRILYSKFDKLVEIKRFGNNFQKALKELLAFEHGK